MLYYIMLCYVVLCLVMLSFGMLCRALLSYLMLCYVMSCYVLLYYVMLCCVVSWSRYQQSQRPWPKLLLCLRCQHLGFFLITFFSFDLAFAIHYHQRLGQYFKDIKYYFLLCSLVLCYVLLCCVMLCCVFVLVMLNYVILCYVVLCYVFFTLCFVMLWYVVSWSRRLQSQRPWPKLLLCLRCQHLGFSWSHFFLLIWHLLSIITKDWVNILRT